MKIISVDEMKQLEKKANTAGLTYKQMMANAGTGLAEVLIKRNGTIDRSTLVIGWVGPGNNGGDTLIALTMLANAGWHTISLCYKRDPEKEELCLKLKSAGGVVLSANAGILEKILSESEYEKIFILDGFLGTGFHLPIDNELAEFLGQSQQIIKSKNAIVIAVDCPSGVNCTNGEADQATVKADLTVCMASVEKGLLEFPAFEYAGEFEVVDIGLNQIMPGWDSHLPDIADPEMVARILPARPRQSHKGTFGKVLILGSSINYCGAVLMAAKAAYRTGSGLVTVGVTEPVYSVIAGQLPEATWIILPGDLGNITEDAINIIQKQVNDFDAILIGPGLGVNNRTDKFVMEFISSFKKNTPQHIGFIKEEKVTKDKSEVIQPHFVLDADALKCLAKIKEWWKLLSEDVVLTPHPGEMSVLTGLVVKEIQNDRMGVAKNYAKLWKKVVVLKGALTIIADPEERMCIIPVATSALAHAGTGDVLAGMITSLIGQGVSAFEAAIAGAYLHAQAGLEAVPIIGSESSVMAMDVLDRIGGVIGIYTQKK